MNTIEDSLHAKLSTLSAVTAIVGTRIRPFKLDQKESIADTGPALIIRTNREEPQNDLSHVGGLVMADVSVIACASTNKVARTLAEAVRSNNTNPGTGLAGADWNEAGIAVDSCCLVYQEPDFIPYRDDSDEGFYVVDAHYTVMYAETV